MKICPNCGSIANFNTHFGAFICRNCNSEDDSYNIHRIERYSSLITYGKKKLSEE